MNVKKLCKRENNTNHKEDNSGIYLSGSQCLPLSLSGSSPGDVRSCPSLAPGSLFEPTSDPQSVAVSFRFGWTPLFCPASFPSARGSGLVHLMVKSTASTMSTNLQRGPLVQFEGWNPWVTPRCCCLIFRDDGGYVSLPCHHRSCSVPVYFQ